MSKPVAGKPYIVKTGDTFERIASIVFGDPTRAREIEIANQVQELLPGKTIKIPVLKIVAPVVNQTGFSLVIGGRIFPVESLRFFESIKTIVDSWTAVIAWVPGADIELDKIIKPFSYSLSSVYLDGELLGTGRLYVTAPGLQDRSQAALVCYSLAADFLDSTVKPPYEESNVTLTQRAQTLAEPFSIKVDVDLSEDGVFDRVTVEPEKTAGDHLLELTKQRGALISSKVDGDLLIFVPPKTGTPIATIEEGVEGFSGFEAQYDGRKRFSEIRVIGESPINQATTAIARDESVPVTRYKTKIVTDMTAGEVQQAAFWEKAKSLANALGIPIRTRGFKSESGERWKKGKYVTLISPTLFIPDGILMLIESVEFLTSENGDESILTLMPNTVYEEGSIEVLENQSIAKNLAPKRIVQTDRNFERGA